jgi:hypothetical protein
VKRALFGFGICFELVIKKGHSAAFRRTVSESFRREVDSVLLDQKVDFFTAVILILMLYREMMLRGLDQSCGSVYL